MVAAASMLGSLVAIVGFMHIAMVRPARKFLRREIVANLTNISQAIEANTKKVENINRRLQEHIQSGGHVPKRR